MSEKIYIGVDLGGTNIKTGICDAAGRLVSVYEGPTGAEEGADAVLERIAQYVKKLVDDSQYAWEQVEGIGTGIPGFIDVKQGVIRFSPNLVWKNVPAKKILEEKLGKPIKLDNDANVAALGEAWSGAGSGLEHVVCFTMGTGVGGGVIVNGKIVQGFNGIAGELGHIKVVPDLEAIQCGCGQMGCLESVSSATGIVKMATDAVERGDQTSLSALEQITAKDVFDAAGAGDEVAVRIVNRAAFYMGKAMATLAVILNPQRFIIGGGVSRAGSILLEPMRKVFLENVPEAVGEGVDIVPAKLGNNAGIVGAAGLLLYS